MKLRRRILALMIIAGMPLLSRCAFSQIDDHTTMLISGLRANVVRIHTQVRDQKREGFGFVAGEKSGNLYIVTAYHVVSDSQEVNMEFFSYQTGIHGGRAELLPAHDLQHDLAVLVAPVPPGYDWYRECLGQLLLQQRPAKLFFIGQSKGPKPVNWFSAPTPGEVESQEPVDSEFEIAGLWAASGSSGGPLIDSTGIVGMIQTSTPDHTRALNVNFIEEAFRRWEYPWGLKQHHLAITRP
jgi:hypothetical protein